MDSIERWCTKYCGDCGGCGVGMGLAIFKVARNRIHELESLSVLIIQILNSSVSWLVALSCSHKPIE